MHYHCEIILPPVKDVEAAIAEIMAPFSENDPDHEYGAPKFWDWYQIGGRWSGTKLTATLDEQTVEAFYAELKRRKITVSGITAGKQELSPASQEAEVDALWRETFPDSGFDVCPLFRHAGNHLSGDVLTFADVDLSLKCSRLIVAIPNWGESGLRAEYMVEDSIWNGVTHSPVDWDGTLATAVARYTDTIQPDWLVVTVDYHS